MSQTSNDIIPWREAGPDAGRRECDLADQFVRYIINISFLLLIGTAEAQIESESLNRESGYRSEVATPTPEPRCQGYTLGVSWEGWWGTSLSFWRLSEEGKSIRSCLGALRSPGFEFDQLNGATATVDSYLSYESPTYSCGYCDYDVDFSDDMAVRLLMGYTVLSSYIGPYGPGARCLLFDPSGSGLCYSATVYYDSSCKQIPLDRLPPRLCDAGYVSWRDSPISLNIAPAETLTEGMTFVQFPLHPGAAPHTWYTWKASKNHPLLVLDPDHTGRVTSAYQLFGTWTFGGRSFLLPTALKSANLPPHGTQPWRHGYEALGTLDRNKDHRISGEELNPLALWFDENRNGISESGEVRSASEEGIQTLFYEEPVYKDSLDGYELPVAFERTIGDSVVSGSAVDWFSPGDRDKNALIKFESLREARKATRANNSISESPLIPPGRVDRSSPFTGEWEWTSEPTADKSLPSIGGQLRLLAYMNGDVLGASISENHYAQPYPVNSEISFRMFRGGLAKSDVLTFSVSSDSWDLRSTATLAKDKKTLQGQTVAVARDGGRSFSYSWQAKRAAPLRALARGPHTHP